MEKNLQDTINAIHKQSKIIDYIIITFAVILIIISLIYVVEHFTVSTKTKSKNNNGIKPTLINYKRKNYGPNMSTIRAPHKN